MKFRLRTLTRLPFLLVLVTAGLAGTNIVFSQLAEARRAYSYADMYVPQNAEVEVVKPKKKRPPRKPKTKSNPISEYAQKEVVKQKPVAAPVTAIPDFEQSEVEKPKKQSVKNEKPANLSKVSVSKVSETKNSDFNLENKSSADLDRAKKITLEELLGTEVVNGMSSR